MSASAAAEPGLQADERLLARGWLRIGAGLAVAGQAMVFGLAVNLTPADGAGYWVVHGGLIAAALGVLLFLGGDLVRGAWTALRARTITIDLLFLVTLTGAFAGSLVSTVTGTGAVYYEVVAVLIAVHTVGRLLAARSRVAALAAVDRTRREFATARVRGGGGAVAEKAIDVIAATDRVLVAPGGAIPVDGTIVAGHSYIVETSMTGEWRPVAREPGDPVLAGTHAVDGDLEITPNPGPRRLDAILVEVARARGAPNRLQAQADRLIGWFLPVVVTVSGLTFAFWLWQATWPEALFNAMAVLLVACPCAMGLATPIAVWGGLAQLTRLGFVARTGDILDALGRCEVLCLDKTGTLSESRLTVAAWRFEPAFADQSAWLKAAVAALESDLQHPIAEAITIECHQNGDTSVEPAERRVVAGAGVIGVIDGKRLSVGEWTLKLGQEARPAEVGKAVFVRVNGVLAATIELGETWRRGMTEALNQLTRQGLTVEVLTGDTQTPASMPVSVRSGLKPEEKLWQVEAWEMAGKPVVLVGDGVNDAAAMSAASGSIALGGGAELARASAQATMSGDDLRVLPAALQVGRAVRRSVHANLRFAATYNAVGMALAAAGWLHPVVAALLMVGSSLAVAVRATRGSAAVTVPSIQASD